MEERLQKILARGGLASRRAAEQLLAGGRVRVNGKVVTELGSKADPRNDKIEVDGKRVVAEDFVYAVLHKPRGVVSTLSDPEGRPTVAEYVGQLGARCYPVGRLDFATSGVLLITNDGAFADGLLHPKKAVPKTYVVKTNGEMKPEDFKRWETGVRLEDGTTTGRAHVNFLRHEGDKTWFELTISEGKNQQIRRMGVATGFQVMRLSRVAFAGVTSEGLRPGAIRMITFDELRTIKESYGVPKRVRAPREIAEPTRARDPRPRSGAAPSAGAREEREPREEGRTGAPARGRKFVQREDRPRDGKVTPRDDKPAQRGSRFERNKPAAREEAPAVRSGSRASRPERPTRGKSGSAGSRDERAPRGAGKSAPSGSRDERAPRGKSPRGAGSSAPRDERPSRERKAGPPNPRSGPRSEAPRGESRGRSSDAGPPARGGRSGGRTTSRSTPRDDAPARPKRGR